jgi:CubicO group peptidase (beta-lactamase class C family)
LPGVALAIEQDGRNIKTACYGLANLELNVPVSPQSVFQIQSVTKQFTATAIIMLVEEGKVSLEANVATYLDGTPDTWKAVTVRHLLNQTSGIKDFINEPTASLRLEASEEEVFKALVQRPLNFQPGEKYAYSNSNYHLLAMIIRKITGDSYGRFLQQRIFEPLEMRQTRIMSWTDLVPKRVAGYLVNEGQLVNGQFVAESILAYGGGGILSTIEDMTKWDLALRGEKLLKHSILEQMWAPARLNDGSSSSYGFGWGLGGKSPHRFVNHSGGHMTGFSTHILRYLDDDLSVILLVNIGYANPGKMAQVIASLCLPALKPPEPKAIEDKEPNVTDLLKEVEHAIRVRHLDKGSFTPEMFTIMEAALSDTSQSLSAVGDLTATELLERKELSGGSTQYLYRMRFAKGTYTLTLTLSKDGKISGLKVEDN